jgi:hypothetical protein
MTLPRSTLPLAIAATIFAQTAVAQTPISITNGTYFQDFNAMGNGANGTNGTYPSGWSGYRFAGSGTLGQTLTPITHDGSLGTGAVYNFGTTGQTDRALGSLGSGTTHPAFGVVLVNDTGRVLTDADVEVSFRAEQWRTGSSTAANEVWRFQWRVGDGATIFNDTSENNWNSVPLLDMNEILTGSTSSGAVDGNANFVNVGPSPVTFLIWNPGQLLFLRWLDMDNTGTDAGMGIDDFNFTVFAPVPEPATLILCGTALAGFMIRRRRAG